MAAGHGGSRPGSGRPKGAATRTAPACTTHYTDALAYLEAVVRGDEPADGLRIAAARVVLPFQKPKARAPVASPPPRTLRAKEDAAVGADAREAWEAKAEEIRSKHGRAKKGTHHGDR